MRGVGGGWRRGARRNGRKAVCKSGIKTMARWFGAIARALSVATGFYGGEISAFRVSARGVAPGGELGRFSGARATKNRSKRVVVR